MGEAPLIQLHDVVKIYRTTEGEWRPLDGVTASINAGQMIAVMGPSGTGKSTLFRLLNRLEEPDRGSITYRGKPLTEWHPVRLRREVHYVFQTPVLFPGTVEDNLSYPYNLAGERVNRKELVRLLERVGLPAAYLSRRVEQMSGGEKQRVNLARSLALDSPVLLMDEPTSALDPKGASVVEQEICRLHKEGRTIVWITHDPQQAERIAEEIWVLENGQLRRKERVKT
ncbi:ATP-binding cassette domain-containing protein [Polycladomyces sp. WAk]|uniref:ATP-binding cassette domain-containing protein n=1 Tax=Polycladomyces zharkentensis TaxID=2807616 RepID=A0ABS2WID0_9BACL|nr:ATP-binding cassette domain-containing protein [Polycladomyces sp. WAk]MBN2909310.1 ATP-binding cassette domain-containing protein [Polycladomyces sp. WAk]